MTASTCPDFSAGWPKGQPFSVAGLGNSGCDRYFVTAEPTLVTRRFRGRGQSGRQRAKDSSTRYAPGGGRRGRCRRRVFRSERRVQLDHAAGSWWELTAMSQWQRNLLLYVTWIYPPIDFIFGIARRLPYPSGRRPYRLVHGDTESAQRVAQVLWAGVHGICSLGLTQRLGQEGTELLKPMSDSLIENYMRGLSQGKE